MIDITLYGKPSLDFIQLKQSIMSKAKQAGIILHINEETELAVIIRDNIPRIPAVVIDDKTFVKDKDEPIQDYIKTINDTILNKEKFGNMKRIIVPVDFSESSTNALAYAKNLVKNMNAMLEIVHVYHPDISTAEYMPYTDSIAEQNKRDELIKLTASIGAKWFGEYPNQTVKQTFIVGFAADELIKLSEQDDKSLIVMGSSDTSRNMKKVFGSVTTKVAMYAKCPVYIIPPVAPYKPLKNVVYCSKSASIDSLIANRVIELIKDSNPIVHLLNIGFGEDYKMDQLKDVWKEFYPPNNIEVVRIPLENESSVIAEYSEFHDVELVVVARKERGFIQDLFHKSITKELVIKMTRPLLILHS